MPITLSWKGATSLPVEGEFLRPDVLGGLSRDDVAHRLVPVGNTSAEIGDLFAISGEAETDALVLEGDLSHVRAVGQGMASGLLTIRGDVGSSLGQGMLGGTISVEGNVRDGAGLGMRGGFLRIKGSCGDRLGAAEPGARLGMREGVILVDGSIGNDAGLGMRRGLIAVSGSAGDGLGRDLIAGSMFAFGSVGTGIGAGMKRGTLALFGPHPPRISPTFAPSGRDRPPFLTIYLRKLEEWGFPVPASAFATLTNRYNGDIAEGGQGEIFVANEESHHK